MMIQDFERAHREFIALHKAKRTGERLRRLEEGHGHAEQLFLKNVWWPAFGNFRQLHPEYEIVDYDGAFRYLDFAYIRGQLRLALEIDGFVPHVRKIDRRQFIRQLRRQNHLVVDGWKVLRFSYDEVVDQPRRCQQVLQQFMGRWSDDGNDGELGYMEKEVLRMAGIATGIVTPKQIREQFGIGKLKAARIIRNLVERGWLEPVSGQQRIRAYRVRATRLVDGERS